MSGLLAYENYETPEDSAAYRRVKRNSMRRGHAARQIACELVGGHIRDHGTEYMTTNKGKFYLTPRHNSLNTAQRVAISMQGALVVVMDDEAQMAEFFKLHEVRQGIVRFKKRIRKVIE